MLYPRGVSEQVPRSSLSALLTQVKEKREKKDILISSSIKDGGLALEEKFTMCKDPLSKRPYFHRQLRDYHLVKERKKRKLPTFKLSVPEKRPLGAGVGGGL